MIRNHKGFSILETMVAVGLVGIVGLGLASLLTEMNKAQNAANIKAILATQKLKIESLIKDSKSWSAAVNSGLNDGKDYMTCLRVPPVWGGVSFPNGCNLSALTQTWTQTSGTSNGMVLLEGAATYYDSITTASGFDPRGKACNSWPSPACPIRWDISVTMTCQSATPCLTPTVRVIALVNIPIAQQEYMHLSVNPENYKVDVTRGVGTRFDPILVTEHIDTSAGVGGGQCTSVSPGPGKKTRALNKIENDPAGNVVLAGNAVTFQPGSYACRITSPAYKVGLHTISFVNTATGVPLGTSAGANSDPKFPVITNATLEVSFVISSATTFRVDHTCQTFTQTPLSTQLGWTTNYAGGSPNGGTVFTTLACYRNG